MSRQLISALLCALSISTFQGNAEQVEDRVNLDWFEGCWVHSNGITKEYWDLGFEGLLFGRSISIANGELVEFEDMRIQKVENRLYFFASPNGQTPVRFEAAKVTQDSIVFETAEHDFPQRIAYVETKEGLSATISDIEGRSPMSFEMTSCAP